MGDVVVACRQCNVGSATGSDRAGASDRSDRASGAREPGRLGPTGAVAKAGSDRQGRSRQSDTVAACRISVMRPREERRRVVISSRLRCGVQWRDALIVNLSSRGVGLSSGSPPSPGAYVEIRRGAYVIIARVKWVDGVRFGVQTQDCVPVDSLIRQPDAAAGPVPGNGSLQPEERRRTARTPRDRHERSRAFGRAFEFGVIAAFGASAALVAFFAVAQVLQQPLEAVHRALSN